MNKAKFKEVAESERSELRQRGPYGSSSDLYVSEQAHVAVIGIQTSSSGQGHDTIYVVQEKDNQVVVKTVLDETFYKGRMFPTSISKDGRSFFYTIKGERGDFRKEERKIEAD